MASMTYELINHVTTNTLASFASEQDARSALEKFQATDERFASSLVIVAFDDEGLAVDEVVGEDRRRDAGVVPAYTPRRANLA